MASEDSGRSPTLPASAADTLLPDSQLVATLHGSRTQEVLGGRYKLGAKIGAGGMGVVWEAEDLALPRKVAVKILHPAVGDPEAGERLRREAELLAQIDHPNVVSVLDFGFLTADRPYVVMERVRGQPLSAWIAEQGRVRWPQAVELAVQLCDGLGRAHELGIIHRDLKSSNVLVIHDSHGRPSAKIIDFGLAKANDVVDRVRVPTRSGQVFGTPAYMAPEQVRGDRIDARADIYALGIVLFEMLAGRRPWSPDSVVELLYAQLFEVAPLLRTQVPELPAELEAIVARCLLKVRDERYPDVHALRAELLGVGTRGFTVAPVSMTPLSQPTMFSDVPAQRLAPSRSGLAWVGGGLLAAAGLAGAIWMTTRGDVKPLPERIHEPVSELPEAPVLAGPSEQTPAAPQQVQPISVPPVVAPVVPANLSPQPPDASELEPAAIPPREPAAVQPRRPKAPKNGRSSDPTPVPATTPPTPKLRPDGTFDPFEP